jgi:hypothetical protein
MKTIGVSDTTHTKLKRYCENNDINQGGFVESALKYFEKNGIHPVKHESPAAEMTKIVKRLDQVFAFIKKQESEFLRPMTEAVNISENRIQEDLSLLAKADDIGHLIKEFNKVLTTYGNIMKALEGGLGKKLQDQQAQVQEQLKEQQLQNKQAFALLAKLIDAKNQTNVLKNLGSVYEKLNG